MMTQEMLYVKELFIEEIDGVWRVGAVLRKDKNAEETCRVEFCQMPTLSSAQHKVSRLACDITQLPLDGN